MMKRLLILLALIVVVVGLLMPGDSKASNLYSIADTNVPDNEIASSVNHTDTATITITMRTPPLPDE